MGISLDIHFPVMKLCTVGHMILLEEIVSQKVDLPLIFLFHVNRRETICEFLKLYFQDLIK